MKDLTLIEELMNFFKPSFRGIIDVHVHMGRGKEMDEMTLKIARKLGIDTLCCFPPMLVPYRSEDDVRRANEYILKLQREVKEVIGFVYVDPFLVKDVEKFIKEFIGEKGMHGIKIYWVRARNPVLNPIAELAIEYDVPILIHTAHRLYPKDRPGETTPEDIRILARRFPKLKLIMAHLGGGGDWEFALETVKDVNNVYVDIGGSVPDNGLIERALEYVGEERLVFGSDNLFTTAIGKVEAADVDLEVKRKIYIDNPKEVVGID